jgi:hypothetical protein
METFGEISQNITIDLIYHCWVSVMVLFEAKPTRFNISFNTMFMTGPLLLTGDSTEVLTQSTPLK